jgi:hypothetical protein
MLNKKSITSKISKTCCVADIPKESPSTKS